MNLAISPPEPEPAGETKVLVSCDNSNYTVGGEPVSADGYALASPGDVIADGFVPLASQEIKGLAIDTLEWVTLFDDTGLSSFTIPAGYCSIRIAQA